MAKPGEFAVDPPVIPGGVLRGQPQDQPAQVGGRVTACGAAAGLGPALLDQVPMPSQRSCLVTIRCSWQAWDSNRGSAANTARSAHDRRGRLTWRRSTVTS
jgi:hypothetical protein